MNKSSQYNQQQTVPKQCKSEVGELRICQNKKLDIEATLSKNKYK